MSNQPYARFPTLHGQRIVFVAEDDLWTINIDGGIARRLTTALTSVVAPKFSPDGTKLVFTGRDDGFSEIYTMPSEGGEATRLTYTGTGGCRAFGWDDSGESVYYGANHEHPFSVMDLFKVSAQGGPSKKLPEFGSLSNFSTGSKGQVAVGRLTSDSARWKRYRGGTAGEIWVDVEGKGQFKRLCELKGNVGHPIWVGDRLYFVSDHEGIGNIYSCIPDSFEASLKRHSSLTEFYARWPSLDGTRIVFHAGGDLFILDTETDDVQKVEVTLHSPRVQRRRKFVTADRCLESFDLHPKGHSIAVTARGRVASMSLWEGAAKQFENNGGRQRHATWLHEGKSFVALSDESGEEALVRYDEDGSQEKVLPGLDFGRAVSFVASPTRNQVLLSNHRYELWILDLENNKGSQIDKSHFSRISGPTWSPDGRWIAYSAATAGSTAEIRVAFVEENGDVEIKTRTEPVLSDRCPSFSQDGKYLYFLSERIFNPVYDDMFFSLGFPEGTVPCVVTLCNDAPSPLEPVSRAPGDPLPKKKDEEKTEDKDEDKKDDEKSEDKKDEKKVDPVTIDCEGFAARVLALPVSEGRYGQIVAAGENKVLYTKTPVKGAIGGNWLATEPPAEFDLYVYDFAKLKESKVVGDISLVEVGNGGKTLVVRKGNKVRVVKMADKLPKESGNNRAAGWVDLGRIRIAIEPAVEWAQMMREAWRLQRDHFWDEKMTGIDWQLIFDRYRPLLDRVSSRIEFSDLMWELQGELGTSHAYEMGGDHRSGPRYPQGRLGADINWDGQGWKIDHIVQGDNWDPSASSPLCAPGVNVSEGEYLVGINNKSVNKDRSPGLRLLNLGGQRVSLRVSKSADGSDAREVLVKTIVSDTSARYREWVDSNRKAVHEATDGKVGYLHIPDMGPEGYAEFFRGFLPEVERQGLIVDARFNRGGHVSQLLLEKLARKRLGYDIQRYGHPEPYPAYTVAGPIVGLTNEFAGSDGDIFSHSFKMLELGPLIGKRTWGGVIGIHPRHALADGTVTTQPEFSFWFHDVGYAVENYGTDPTIEIDHPPHEQNDIQLERAIKEAMDSLEKNPPEMPNFDEKPDLSLPKLKW
ncbi:MAG: PDZ domain-containing protein [Planctomycetota bacterium]|nr:PDZ domain-containing protein [Planctomycetota bacterium]